LNDTGVDLIAVGVGDSANASFAFILVKHSFVFANFDFDHGGRDGIPSLLGSRLLCSIQLLLQCQHVHLPLPRAVPILALIEYIVRMLALPGVLNVLVRDVRGA